MAFYETSKLSIFLQSKDFDGNSSRNGSGAVQYTIPMGFVLYNVKPFIKEGNRLLRLTMKAIRSLGICV